MGGRKKEYSEVGVSNANTRVWMCRAETYYIGAGWVSAALCGLEVCV